MVGNEIQKLWRKSTISALRILSHGNCHNDTVTRILSQGYCTDCYNQVADELQMCLEFYLVMQMGLFLYRRAQPCPTRPWLLSCGVCWIWCSSKSLSPQSRPGNTRMYWGTHYFRSFRLFVLYRFPGPGQIIPYRLPMHYRHLFWTLGTSDQAL